MCKNTHNVNGKIKPPTNGRMEILKNDEKSVINIDDLVSAELY